ncbi:MAG: hypothetical protein Q8N26_14970 [Myxococcales bacterium]|nr:hypothetical protein [Myxococcales bacterium]
MTDFAWQATSLLGRLLWSYGLSTLLSTLLWGLLLGAVGVALTVQAWRMLSRRGLLDFGVSWDRWQRIVVLVLSVVGGAGLLGAAGLCLGAERAAVHVIREEQVVALACRSAFETIAESIIREANARTSRPIDPALARTRTSLQSLWLLHERRFEAVAAIERTLLKDPPLEPEDDGFKGQLRRLITRWVVDSARTDLVNRSDAHLVAILKRLEPFAREDGTVGVEDIAGAIGGEALGPAVEGVVCDLFGSVRTPLYLWFLLVLAVPPLLAWAVRWTRRWSARRAP